MRSILGRGEVTTDTSKELILFLLSLDCFNINNLKDSFIKLSYFYSFPDSFNLDFVYDYINNELAFSKEDNDNILNSLINADEEVKSFNTLFNNVSKQFSTEELITLFNSLNDYNNYQLTLISNKNFINKVKNNDKKMVFKNKEIKNKFYFIVNIHDF